MEQGENSRPRTLPVTLLTLEVRILFSSRTYFALLEIHCCQLSNGGRINVRPAQLFAVLNQVASPPPTPQPEEGCGQCAGWGGIWTLSLEWANTGPGNCDGLKMGPILFFLTSVAKQEGLILATDFSITNSVS